MTTSSASSPTVADPGSELPVELAVDLNAELDVGRLRAEFPILAQRIHGHPLAYFDSAASAQRPERVIAAIDRCYHENYSNVHRGVHTLSQRVSEAYEAARAKVQGLLGAASADEVVFVRGTTEAINLVAQSYGRHHVKPGDEVLVTVMEHHSNLVPWQMLCEERDAKLVVAPVDDRGDLVLEELTRFLSERTRVVALAHVSNTLGTQNPVREIVDLAHRAGAVVMVDGAQAAPHIPIDVVELDCDFYAFSGHKAYGPSGIGVLYGKRELLSAMPPWQGGGGMIRSVSFTGTSYADPPQRFEAGTPDITGAIGLGEAVDFLRELGWQRLERHEDRLLERLVAGLATIPEVTIIGRPRRRVGVVSFVVEGVHAHDVGTLLDRDGIAVRVGHHCTQPLLERFGVSSTTRASVAAFNTEDEVDRLVASVGRVVEFFA